MKGATRTLHFFVKTSMKKLLRSFSTFTRRERTGLFVLFALLLVVIGIRATLSLWLRPDPAQLQLSRMTGLWDSLKTTADTAADEEDDPVWVEPATSVQTSPKPVMRNIIDLNSADSAQLSQVTGISPAMAGRIITFRSQHGRFQNVQQLRQLGNFTPAELAEMKNQLVISHSERAPKGAQ